MDGETFWMVYGMGQHAPSYRHATVEAASKEAERLAARNPGITFVVLMSIEAVRFTRERVVLDPDFREVQPLIVKPPQHELENDVPF